MSDDQERWRRLTALFHAALERPPAEREAFVIAACGDDAALLVELRSLLSAHERASKEKQFENLAVEHDQELMAEAGSGESLVGKSVGRDGRYRIEKKISEGGMGIVYLAEDTKLHRRVAFKALPAAFTADPARRERHRREALAAAQLSHPAVAVVYDLEETDDGSFIASEYIQGHNLREDLERGPLPPDDVLEIARAVASALAAAHAQGIVHRDLKPENVMRARNGAVKVLDYGLALLLSGPDTPTGTRLTVDGRIVGTPGYWSPEQKNGLPVDERADVYSFGVLVHELATGRLPGSGTQAPLPASLDSIVRKCLAQEPADRFRNGAAIVAALEAAPSSARKSGASAPPAPIWWWQFHQIAISALHASLLVAVWFARGGLDRPWRSLAFLAAIGAAVPDVTMRLNLWFVSRVQPGALALQRARFRLAILAADGAYALVLCALAAVVAGEKDELAAVLVGGAIVSLLSLLLIEPATSRAAFGRPHRATPKGPRTPRPRTPRRTSPRPQVR